MSTRISIVLLGAVFFPPIQVFSQHSGAAVEDAISARSLAGPLAYLADDLLEGRGVGSRGDQLSRQYLQSLFELFGLEPGGVDGSYQQPVPIVGITASPHTPLTVQGPNGEAVFEAPKDYVAFAAQPLARTRWEDLEIVFVGYGITAPEQDWNDFKDVDVSGKVLLVMNNDPSSDPKLFEGKTRLYYGRWTYKYEEAARRGAAGAIVIHTTESAGYPFQVIQAGQGQEQFHLPFSNQEAEALAIQAWSSEEAARRIAAFGGHDLDDLREQAERREFRPVSLGVKASLATANTIRSLTSGNVLGRLPGSDPTLAEEAVVVTAHFDHLGIGPPKSGDAIYNGALDNASGCAALVNLAMACSRLEPAPRRSILFAAVTAEESGLLGSLYFARNPTIPRKKMVANFNIDGINIWGSTRDIGMVGFNKNSLTEVAQEVARRRGRELVPDAEVDKGLFYRSDHLNFARIGVPCAYFKAGNDFLQDADGKRRLKLSYTSFHYHQPSDEFDARWNLEGAVSDTRFILECLLEVANADDPPTWKAGDEFEKAR